MVRKCELSLKIASFGKYFWKVASTFGKYFWKVRGFLRFLSLRENIFEKWTGQLRAVSIDPQIFLKRGKNNFEKWAFCPLLKNIFEKWLEMSNFHRVHVVWRHFGVQFSVILWSVFLCPRLNLDLSSHFATFNYIAVSSVRRVGQNIFEKWQKYFWKVDGNIAFRPLLQNIFEKWTRRIWKKKTIRSIARAKKERSGPAPIEPRALLPF